MLEKVSQWELDGIREADVFLMLLPGGRGSHAELGAALALKKPSLIISLAMENYFFSERPCSFHHHPEIQGRLFHPNIVRLSSMAQRKASALWRKHCR